MLKNKILFISAISIFICSLIACTNLNKQDRFPTLEEECKLAGSSSKQCEILNKEDFTLDDKQAALGFLYLFGANTVIVDYDKAYYWFEKSATAKNNEALDGLGMIYFAGLGKDKDFQKAEEYFLEANKYGSKDAKLNLAELYRVKDFGRSPDFEKAESWYLLGAQDNPSRAYEGLSKMYLDQENYEKAFIFSEKAAELDNPEAQYNLGVFFEQGVYVKKDKKQAEYWYEKAAKQGHLNAINNLNILRKK
ncbi:sel1 repeat family protein [Acinetobacter indicus]|uniref:tetratricopeptide repeat protein n=2 Tax=Acinetobacter indicus TaxID=756892 RepID=UPI000CECCE42|nr:tetratricopeptide repeat protein [Acinetobacter indicus]QIZ60939.1 sel1 repeat family protein [Acinetobacter indicus]